MTDWIDKNGKKTSDNKFNLFNRRCLFQFGVT